MDLNFQLASSVLVAAPWSIGAALALLATRARYRCPGYEFVWTGIGGLLGLFFVSGAIWLINGLAIRTDVIPLQTVAFLASGACLMALLAIFLPRITKIRQPLAWCLLALTIGTIVVGFNHTVLTPIFSWDALGGEWRVPGYAARAVSLIGSNESEAFLGETIQHRHPRTHIFLLSWSGWAARDYGNFGAGIPWFLLYLSCILMMAGCSFIFSGSITASLFSAWLIATLPLFENHALISGYIETLIAAILLAACSLIYIGIRGDNKHLIALGLILSILLVTTKSTGSAYMAAVFFGYITVLGLSIQRKYLYGSICIALICVFYLATQGFQLDLFGAAIGWNPTTEIVEYAGRNQLINELDIPQIATNQFYSMLTTSSYSIAIISVLLALLVECGAKSSLGSALSLIFILATLFFGVVFFSATQITEYGMLHALPSRDTQNSRSFMPFSLLSVIAIMHLVSSRHEHDENSS